MTEQAYEIREKLMQLESALLNEHPTMPTLLRDIHKTLLKDQDLVTILTEEECAILVNGLSKLTDTNIATAALKKGTKKSLKSMTVDDL